jgi:NAD(P)-dependent dehydrogenase (short-subunit alcohol dehydrogenase family)
MQLAVPHLTKTKGSIVNISSAAADGNTSSIAFYVASKHAQNSLTKSFAAKFAKAGVRVNSVSPAIIDDTKILKKSDDPLVKAAANCYFSYISQYATPLKRPGLSKVSHFL